MRLEPAAAERMRSTLATVAAIPVTPFGPDGGIDTDAHARLIGRMIEAGITLITPNGNTGEFYTLSAGEARAPVLLGPVPPQPGIQGPGRDRRGVCALVAARLASNAMGVLSGYCKR